MAQSLEYRIIPQTIFFVPGQDSQYPGMGQRIREQFPIARRVYKAADDLYKRRMGEVNFVTNLSLNGTEKQQMPHAQLLLTTHACATIAVIRSEFGNIYPEFSAGNSAGEPAAAHAAGALNASEAIALAYEREKVMNHPEVEKGGMAAISGLGRDAIDMITKKWADLDLVLSNTFPVKEFVIVSGPIHALEEAMKSAKDMGARLARQLKISIASHHPKMMAGPASEFADVLSNYPFNPPISKLIMDAVSDIVGTADGIRDNLALALLRPVRLDEIFNLFVTSGGKHLVDIGPGDSISKHAERGKLPLDTITVDTPGGMQQLAKLLGK